MLILYAYETNTIAAGPIKTRSDTDMLCKYDVLYKNFENPGQAQRLNIMENEASIALKGLLQKKKNSGTIITITQPQNKCIVACYTHIQK